jgi:hypothetical protein
MKSVFALGRGAEAVLSHHLGDLDSYEAWKAFTASIDRYERLFHVVPEVIAHDLHPDYPTTRYALERAARAGLRLAAVQHHHAHLAACLAENGLDGPAIGVTFDGTGYGTDGTIWGGEFLIGDYRSFRRPPASGPWRCRAASRRCGSPGGWRSPTSTSPGRAWTSFPDAWPARTSRSSGSSWTGTSTRRGPRAAAGSSTASRR